MIKRTSITFLLTATMTLSSVALANAPVEEVAGEPADMVTTSALNEAVPEPAAASVEGAAHQQTWQNAGRYEVRRVQKRAEETSYTRLQRQVNQLVKMHLPQKLQSLQHQIAVMRGKLQQQSHALRQLKAKLAKVTTAPVAAVRQKTTTPAPVAASSPAADYHNAFSMLVNKQYASAKQQFQRYIAQNPTGHYASNAHYWLAEIALIGRDYKAAETSLNTVIQQFPNSQKYADARYKLAITHQKMHKNAQAQMELKKIQQDFPGSTIARLAGIALEQMTLDQT